MARTFENQGHPDPNLISPGHNIIEDTAYPSTAELVHKLLHLDKVAIEPTVKGVKQKGWVRIRISWAKAKLTEAHFIYNPKIHRSVLREDSKVRKYGLEAGLPRAIWEWLCGDEEVVSNETANEDCWMRMDDYHLQK